MDNKQYLVLKQPTRKLYASIDVINDKNYIVDNIEAFVTDGQLNFSASGSYRRSGNISLIITHDNKLIPEHNGKIWFDKRVGINIGIENYLGEIIWFKMGRFAILDAIINETISETTINLNLSDYMCFLDGTLGGTITEEVKILEKDVTINQAVKSIVEGLVDFSIERTTFNGSDLTLPYKIEKLPAITAYSLISEVQSLYMNYEFFFDENGYFVFRRMLNQKNDDVVWDFTDDDFRLNFQTKIDFTEVKNKIAIFGYTDNYGVQIKKKITNRGKVNNIELDKDSIISLNQGDIFYSDFHGKSYMYQDDEWIELDYIVNWKFGSDFIGMKPLVINDNSIFNDEQSIIRAEYELVHSNRFNEIISFSSIPLFHLDVNKKIKVKSDKLNTIEDYLIDTMSIPLGYSGDMSISANKIFY